MHCWGLTETPVAEKVVDGVYALRGWGIAMQLRHRSPGRWIIVDTGDSTRPRPMRELLERTLGKGVPAKGGGPLAELDGTLDRSHLMPAAMRSPTVMAATERPFTPTAWSTNRACVCCGEIKSSNALPAALRFPCHGLA